MDHRVASAAPPAFADEGSGSLSCTLTGVCIRHGMDLNLISRLDCNLMVQRGLAHLFAIPLLTTPAAALQIDNASATATAARVVIHIEGSLNPEGQGRFGSA
jgi:hypothetical protein